MSENPLGHLPDPWSGRRKSRWEKIRDQVEANRRGEYVVPTWVLALVLVAMVAGLTALIVYANQGR